MSKELPAEDLLARVAQQDAAALGELYDRYAPRVYGLLARILPVHAAAEEALQEVFLRLWSEGPFVRQEGGSVAAWLVFTARQAAIERLGALRKNPANGSLQGRGVNVEKGRGPIMRKSKGGVAAPAAAKSLDAKTPAVKPRLGEGRFPAPRAVAIAWLPSPKEITLIDDRLALLQKVINQLPKPQRRALELAVFGGLSEAEIAVEMGEPLGRVRTSLRAAVTFIKHRRRAVCGTWAANF